MSLKRSAARVLLRLDSRRALRAAAIEAKSGYRGVRAPAAPTKHTRSAPPVIQPPHYPAGSAAQRNTSGIRTRKRKAPSSSHSALTVPVPFPGCRWVS